MIAQVGSASTLSKLQVVAALDYGCDIRAALSNAVQVEFAAATSYDVVPVVPGLAMVNTVEHDEDEGDDYDASAYLSGGGTAAPPAQPAQAPQPAQQSVQPNPAQPGNPAAAPQTAQQPAQHDQPAQAPARAGHAARAAVRSAVPPQDYQAGPGSAAPTAARAAAPARAGPAARLCRRRTSTPTRRSRRLRPRRARRCSPSQVPEQPALRRKTWRQQTPPAPR